MSYEESLSKYEINQELNTVLDQIKASEKVLLETQDKVEKLREKREWLLAQLKK